MPNIYIIFFSKLKILIQIFFIYIKIFFGTTSSVSCIDVYYYLLHSSP